MALDLPQQEIEDEFKSIFKKYKKFDLANSNDATSQIIDFSDLKNDLDCGTVQEISIDAKRYNQIDSPIKHDIRDVHDLKLFTLKRFHAGLLVIPQILTKQASQKWFHYLLNQLPYESDMNGQLKSNIALPPPSSSPVSQSNLRWITFGHHHDWDSKQYAHNENAMGVIPTPLIQLSQYISNLLAFESFKLEAGIVNYYTCKSTLCPHTDHSEPNQSAPLFSLSLGSPAIFLIGGKSKSDLPIYPILLRDGDLMIMSLESRQSYHAVSQVICSHDGDQSLIKSSRRFPVKPRCDSSIRRININMRQVF